MSVNSAPYRDLFLAEARRQLHLMRECLDTLQRAPDDLGVLDQLYRAAHSLRGMAALMGLDEFANSAQALEEVIEPLRSHHQRVTPPTLELLFYGLHDLEALQRAIESRHNGQAI